ncbi:MAG: hypothetical protein V7739_06300 [Motiliproteus sp.]
MAKRFLLISGLYGLLFLPYLFWPEYGNSPVAWLALLPMLSIYIFHRFGIPGLLEHNGLCGWGWCSPTLAGWILAVVFTLLVFWLLAWLMTKGSKH